MITIATTVLCFSISGISGNLVEVETELLPGMATINIVGLGDKAVKEARERLEAAINYSQYSFPQQRIVFNLAPSDIKKTGTHFDLAMAIGLLARSNQIKILDIKDIGFIGELSLNVTIRPVSGILPMALKAKETGITRLVVPFENVKEASLVKELKIFGCSNLSEVIHLVEGRQINQQYISHPSSPTIPRYLDFSEVKGQSALMNM